MRNTVVDVGRTCKACRRYHAIDATLKNMYCTHFEKTFSDTRHICKNFIDRE